MNKAVLKSWLDTQVDLYRTFNENISCVCDEREVTCTLSNYTSGVHITHAVKVADWMGIPVHIVRCLVSEYPVRAAFKYDGVEFFSLYTDDEFSKEYFHE